MTKEEFVQKAIKIHGNKYNYDKVKYINNKTHVIITCPIHGDFEQTPEGHLKGHGCRKCSNEKLSKAKLKTQEKFIQEAKLIHPEYDYSKVKYVSSSNPITLVCPKHGDFIIYPNDLLHKGKQCKYCNGRSMNTTSFIEKCKFKFGDKFDYSKVNYIDSKTPVTIICPEHGEFQTTPSNFLRKKYGCSKCSHETNYTNFAVQKSKGEIQISKWLENNNIFYEYNKHLIKIDGINIYPDFVINNIIIEYNGEQHYRYVPFFHTGGEIDFEKQQNRDNKLREYCKQNSIHLIEIKYNDDIEKVLENNKNLFNVK